MAVMSEFHCRIKTHTNGTMKASAPSGHDTAYAGASYRRKQLANWAPSRSPADLDLLPELDTLVARTRDLDRNNGIAAGIFQTLNDNIVGTGLRLAATPDYRALGKTIAWAEEWGRQVESLWKTWAEGCSCDAAYRRNFASMSQLVFRSALQNGETLALALWLDRPNIPWHTAVQLVDSDRLSNPIDKLQVTKNLRGGIEIDDFGRPIAYHIRAVPEYLTLYYGPQVGGPDEWVRVPAETEWGRKRVIHMYEQQRIDQTRGAPILTPIIEQFRMLDSYQRTELQSAIVNAIVAGIIETPMDPAGIAELVGGDGASYLAAKNEYRVQLEGGTLIPLWPGDKLQPFTPSRPVGTFGAFVETIQRQIGAAVGLPYELVAKDFSKTNYSSARAALLEAWRFFSYRRQWMATYWYQPVYELWLEEAINAGLVEAPEYYELKPFYTRAKWIGPGRGWVDPVKEAEAARIRMENNISTLEMECAEQGYDWQEILEQRAIEVRRIDELGLTPVMPPAGPATEKQDDEEDGVQEGEEEGQEEKVDEEDDKAA
jgi:lambda family phage portal protein